ncbi:MAG: prepilin-type N-terminal cleavage/methylation domain-containing protein, partial [Deltaproteobacteria bacterium]|nr:prepilin-type N-terminal cleavage/methylation domain-containing protein [Deltaproteobacteria bacterium]
MPNTNETRRRQRLARPGNQGGFTLIEIMIVITIFAMMAGGVAVALLPQL